MEPDETADDGGAQLRAGLAAALKDALRARDPAAASALRPAAVAKDKRSGQKNGRS